jgi:beta-N-acetylhexosaminidase
MSPSGVRRQLGQLVMLGLHGVDVPVEIRALAREFDLGGVVLFSRNVESPEQVAALAQDLSRLVEDPPLWVAVDQEGGRVARLKRPFTEWPPMATLGRCGDSDLAERFADALAQELRAVGVNLDFAPVLDVLTHRDNPAIGDRAIADTPDDVARLGATIIRALQAGGVAACGKHFPGHGDTSVDSHHGLPVVEHGPDRLHAIELVPFKAAIRAGVASIITAHVLVPALDAHNPASMSRPIVTGLLRETLGFDGIVFTDDTGMRACADRFTPEEATIASVNAGSDGVLLCTPDYASHAAALEALVHAVETGAVPYARVEKSIARQRTAKERFLAAGQACSPQSARWKDILGCDAHRQIALEMQRYAL